MKKKNWYKGLTATAITLAMAGAAFSVPALAIDYDLNYGDVHVGSNDDGTVWSGQTQDGGESYFHYETTGTDGQYEFVSGKYQHTNSTTGEVDTEVNISQGFVENLVDGTPETTPPADGETFGEVVEPTVTDTTDNTVTVSGDLTGNDTDETNDVQVTISDVTVDTNETFLTVEEGTKGEITIEDSEIEAGNRNDAAIVVEDGNVTIDSATEDGFVIVENNSGGNGVEVSGNAHLDVEANFGVGGYVGIDLSENSSVSVNDNILEVNGSNTGIHLADEAQLTVNEDVLRVTGGTTGISLNDQSELNITGGTGYVTGLTGIQMEDESELSISGGQLAVSSEKYQENAIEMSADASISIQDDGYLFTTDNAGNGGIAQEGNKDTGYDVVDADEVNSGTHYGYYDQADKEYDVYWDIAADATGNQTIELGDMATNSHAMHLNLEQGFDFAGQAIHYNYEIVNRSNHTYGYQDGSFEAEGVVGDGLESEAARLPNQAICDLYKIDEEAKVTFYQMLGVVDKLIADGYTDKNGIHHTYALGEDGNRNAVLEQFYLDYYNAENETKYTSFGQLPVNAVYDCFFDSDGIGTHYNGIYVISREEYDALSDAEKEQLYISSEVDDILSVQIKETSEPLSGYGYFYSYIFAMAIGDEAFEQICSASMNNRYGTEWQNKDYDSFYFLNQYNKDNLDALYWDDVNEYFSTLFGNNWTGKDSPMAFKYAWGLDGPKMGNNYQNYSFSWETTIILDQLDGVLDLTKVDEEGNVITSDEATFQIWYDDEDGIRYYLTLGEDGLYSFVTDESTVDTIDGRLFVEYALLEGKEYNIKEVTAPDGYVLDDTTQVLTLKNSEDPFVLSVTNVAEEEETPPTIDPDPPVDPPYIPDYPDIPDYDPPTEDIDDEEPPLVETPDEEDTEEIVDEETPLTPSIPDEEVDEIIAEIEDEVTPLTSVPKTGTKMPAATAALPAGVLAAAVAAMVRKIRRKG